MRVYMCLYRDRQGELTYATSFIDRAKARTWFLEAVKENIYDSLTSEEAEAEFDSYIPRMMNAESDTAVVMVIQTED